MEYQVKSKIYVPVSKKNSAIFIVINIAVIIIAICLLVSIFMSGISIANISSVIIALFVSITFKSKMKSIKEDHYEFSIAKISLFNNIFSIEHSQYNMKITFKFDAIELLEYSDKLQCLRMVGNYTTVNGNISKDLYGEYLLYIDFTASKEIIDAIENSVNKKINYVDRKDVK